MNNITGGRRTLVWICGRLSGVKGGKENRRTGIENEWINVSVGGWVTIQ